MSADAHTRSDQDGAANDAVAAPLDLLLSDAATSLLRRMNPGGSGVRLAAALAGRARLGGPAGGGAGRAGNRAETAAGRSRRQPSRRDRRFTDPAWTGNPLLRRAMQAYLATAESVGGVVGEGGVEGGEGARG